MRHDVSAEEFALRFRPVRFEDAAFIVWLRNLDQARGRVGDSAADVVAQEQWLQAYFDRSGDWYFLIESIHGLPVGTHGFYDRRGESAETGRWIVRPGVPAALGSALLAIHIAFNVLGLKEARARTVACNKSVLSIHEKLGFRRVRLEPRAQMINGNSVDMVHSVMFPEDGAAARMRLRPAADWAAAKLERWERTQLARSEPNSVWEGNHAAERL